MPVIINPQKLAPPEKKIYFFFLRLGFNLFLNFLFAQVTPTQKFTQTNMKFETKQWPKNPPKWVGFEKKNFI